MTQLRSCYFCGTTGALSEYATLPKALRSDDEQAPRVVLCNRCHTKLTNVLSPIVEQLSGADRSKSAATSPGSDEPTPEPSAVRPSHSATEQPEVTFPGSAPRDDSAEATARGERSTDTASSPADDESDAPDETDGTGASERGGSSEADDDDAEASDTADGSSDAVAPDDPKASPSSDETAGGSDTTSPSDTPARLERVYHQLLRFLRNREFPIPRSEAETIAQSAYDLSATEASEVIQLTIDRDVLDERGGELHRR